MRANWIALAILASLCSCSADLKRVHTPDLQLVEPVQQTRFVTSSAAHTAPSSVTEPAKWKIYTNLQDSHFLVDRDVQTVSYSPRPEMKDQFILIDLGAMCTMREVVLAHPTDGGNPKRFRIDVAGEHNFPYSLAHVGEGAPGLSRAAFAQPMTARFMRITLLEGGEQPWRITELQIR